MTNEHNIHIYVLVDHQRHYWPRCKWFFIKHCHL